MFPNRRQGQRQNDRCGSLVSPSLFSSVPVESLIVLFSVVVSYFITFNFSDIISEKVSIKKWSKIQTKNTDHSSSRFFYFQSLPYSCISSDKSYGKFATSCKKDKTSFCQLGAISRSMIIHD